MSSNHEASSAMDDNKPKQVPKLRFPEFLEAEGWRELAGDALFDQINDRKPEPGLPVLAITQEHGAIPRHLIDYHVSVSEKSIESYKVVRVGDFIISLRSFQGGIEYSQYDGICSPAYVILRLKIKDVADYFRYYFKTKRFIGILTKNLEGLRDGKMISYAQFSRLLISVPSRAEQQRIAECLSSVDELIAAQACKIEALKIQKKSLMQQLFPGEGETEPRLRFPEYRNFGGWKQTKLGSHVTIQSGNSPSRFILSQTGKYPFVKVEDLNNCIKYQISSREFCDDVVGVVPVKSILFPKRGAAIELNKIRISAADILIDTNLMALVPKDGLNVEFLYYYLSNVKLSHIADLSTIPQINNKHIIPFDLLLPVEAEQQRIADCLSCLDEHLAAQIQKHEAFKAHKKGLMQQLFPTQQEVEA